MGEKETTRETTTTLGCLKNYFVPRRPQSNRLAGWRVVSLFLFFFLISGHERSVRKGSSIPQATHARPFIFLFLLFCSAALFYKCRTEAGF